MLRLCVFILDEDQSKHCYDLFRTQKHHLQQHDGKVRLMELQILLSYFVCLTQGLVPVLLTWTPVSF